MAVAVSRLLQRIAGSRCISLFALLAVVSLWAAEAHPGYVGSIPNGFKVKGARHPLAIGHVNQNGGGARNQFGTDFHNNQYKWTKTLCRMDSDGDGATNGEELGDPECVWKKGKTPSRTSEITHPGIPHSLDTENNPQAAKRPTGGFFSQLKERLFGGGGGDL